MRTHAVHKKIYFDMSISEEKRVEFTKKLKELRDSDTRSIDFSPDLTSEQRQFIHKLSQEYGLKSKSAGKGDKRFITVTKKDNNAQRATGLAPACWEPHPNTSKLLSDACFSTAICNRTKQNYQKVNGNKSDKSPYLQPAKSQHQHTRREVCSGYHQAQNARCSSTNYNSIQRKRNMLPAAHHRLAVCSLVKANQIVLISGETGCGKSTQVPQFLLDDADIGPTCRIAVTQPRRISAVAVAERIAAERSETIGNTVGYNIRLDAQKSKETQVLFLTPGVLIRKLQTDPHLDQFTHIIVDEAHERDRFTEFLQIILRDICEIRKDLRLILMSATMHTHKIRSYFGDIPQINVGGSVFPVTEFFLEDVLRCANFSPYVQARCSPTAMLPLPGHGKGPSAAGDASNSMPLGATNTAFSTAMEAMSESVNDYFCSLCSAGPYKSPEELGMHSASCYPAPALRGPQSQQQQPQQQPQEQSTKRGGLPAAVATAEKRTSAEACRLNTLAAKIHALRTSSSAASFAAINNGDVGSQTKTELVASPPDDSFEDINSLAINHEQEDEDRAALQEEEEVCGVGYDSVELGVAVSDTALQNESGSRVESNTSIPSASSLLLESYQRSWDDNQVDTDLILELLKYLFSSAFLQQGSVLVFLPGWDDISRMMKLLSNTPEFADSRKLLLIQLHSGIQRKDQDLVFKQLAPGQHKIILSTNIAETSITIDDVAVVINTGRVKEKTYDPHTKLSCLQSTWISQASARQRRGRAGRTQAGVCFHLYSSLRSQHLSDFQDSELLRMPLEELVVQAKAMGLAAGNGSESNSITSFLLKAMDPPHLLSISNAISLLQSINCLDSSEQLTSVGQVVSQLPLNPRLGRMILLGCLLGCGPSILATAAAMGYRDPFVIPTTDHLRALSNKMKARLAGAGGAAAVADAPRTAPAGAGPAGVGPGGGGGGMAAASDQMVVLRAMRGFTAAARRSGAGAARRFCDEHFLSFTTMTYLEDLVGQLFAIMKDCRIQVNHTLSQRNDGNTALVLSVIGAGLYPDCGIRRKGAKIFSTEKACKAKLHPSSVNAKLPLYRKECLRPIESVGFQDLIASMGGGVGGGGAAGGGGGGGGGGYIGGANLLMTNTTPLSMLTVLLMCGRLEQVSSMSTHAAKGMEESESELESAMHVEVEVDGWFSLQLHRDLLLQIQRAREVLSSALVMFLQNPSRPLPKDASKALDKIVEALSIEQRRCC